MGYKEPATIGESVSKIGWRPLTTHIYTWIEDKRERKGVPKEDESADDVEREDEQPTVVVLKAGDIGPEEFQAYRQHMKGE